MLVSVVASIFSTLANSPLDSRSMPEPRAWARARSRARDAFFLGRFLLLLLPPLLGGEEEVVGRGGQTTASQAHCRRATGEPGRGGGRVAQVVPPGLNRW